MSVKAILIVLLVSLAVGLYWPMGVARSQDYDDYYACYGPGYHPYYGYCDYYDGYSAPFGVWGFDFDFGHGYGHRDFDRGEHHFHGGGHEGFRGGGHGHH